MDRARLRTFLLGGAAGPARGCAHRPPQRPRASRLPLHRAGEARERGRESYFETREGMRERRAALRRAARGPSGFLRRGGRADPAPAAQGVSVDPEGPPPSEPSGRACWGTVGEAERSEELRRKVRETRERLRASRTWGPRREGRTLRARDRDDHARRRGGGAGPGGGRLFRDARPTGRGVVPRDGGALGHGRVRPEPGGRGPGLRGLRPPRAVPPTRGYSVGPFADDAAMLAYVGGDVRTRRRLLVRMLRELRLRGVGTVEAVASDRERPHHVPTEFMLQSGWRPVRRAPLGRYTLVRTELEAPSRWGAGRALVRKVRPPSRRGSRTTASSPAPTPRTEKIACSLRELVGPLRLRLRGPRSQPVSFLPLV